MLGRAVRIVTWRHGRIRLAFGPDPGGGHLDGLARRLLDSATREGARSLGLETGELKVGRPADFFTVDLHHPLLAGSGKENLIPALIFGADSRLVREVAVAGNLIVQDGVHPLAEESSRAFSALARRLFS